MLPTILLHRAKKNKSNDLLGLLVIVENESKTEVK